MSQGQTEGVRLGSLFDVLVALIHACMHTQSVTLVLYCKVALKRPVHVCDVEGLMTSQTYY